MSRLVQIATLVRIYTRWAIRDPLGYFLMALLGPLGITLSIGIFLPVAERPFIIVGSVVFSVMVSAMAGLGQDVAVDRTRRRIAIFVSSPVTSVTYACGLALANALLSLTGASLVLVVGVALFRVDILPVLWVLIPSLLFAWLSAVSIALLIGSYSKTTRQAGTWTNFVALALTFFSPVYYPPSALPPLLRLISYASPTTWVAQAIRSALSGDATVAGLSMIAQAVFAGIAFPLSVRHIKWRDR